MGKVILYSTHCPRCKVLELKLKQKNIEFEENNNVEEMTAKGFKEAPKLEITDGTIMDFKQAVDWIKEQ
jgi:glutaredoxin-related protein